MSTVLVGLFLIANFSSKMIFLLIFFQGSKWYFPITKRNWPRQFWGSVQSVIFLRFFFDLTIVSSVHRKSKEIVAIKVLDLEEAEDEIEDIQQEITGKFSFNFKDFFLFSFSFSFYFFFISFLFHFSFLFISFHFFFFHFFSIVFNFNFVPQR